MKASDISDDQFLLAVRSAIGPAMVWDLAERLAVPEKIVRAKARRLIRRGKLTGCACGCRGDFALLDRPL